MFGTIGGIYSWNTSISTSQSTTTTFNTSHVTTTTYTTSHSTTTTFSTSRSTTTTYTTDTGYLYSEYYNDVVNDLFGGAQIGLYWNGSKLSSAFSASYSIGGATYYRGSNIFTGFDSRGTYAEHYEVKKVNSTSKSTTTTFNTSAATTTTYNTSNSTTTTYSTSQSTTTTYSTLRNTNFYA